MGRGRRSDERPTMPPGFDVEKYAKDSDAKIAKVRDPKARNRPPASKHESMPRSETRIATRPDIGVVTTDEAWARTMRGAPCVAVADDVFKRLPLDHRAGFLLSRMDGELNLEMVIVVSGMRREEALRIVRDLYESGIIEFR